MSTIRLTPLPGHLTESLIRKHVMVDPHIGQGDFDEVEPLRSSPAPPPPLTFTLRPHLDLGAFGIAINTILKDIVAGYMLEVRRNGRLVHTGSWGWAQTPADAAEGWTGDTRMHVASVSKFLTAVGLAKALKAEGISYDDGIAAYLPAHWSRGANIDKITFRNLLQHESGFSVTGTNYPIMKESVAAGVEDIGTRHYANMNFGLCRILIPVVLGSVGKSATFMRDASMNDQAWDAVTLLHYKQYMQDSVFTPAGVANASFAPAAGRRNALAYPIPFDGIKGGNSGDLATIAGGVGWRLSTKELLSVMHHVRRRNTIIPSQDAQRLLDNEFGIGGEATPVGTVFAKNGRWNVGDGRWEEAVSLFCLQAMEIALFVNSPIGSEEASLKGAVLGAFVDSLATRPIGGQP